MSVHQNQTERNREFMRRWAQRDPEAVKDYRRRKKQSYLARHPELTARVRYHLERSKNPNGVRARVARANRKRRERYPKLLDAAVAAWYRKHPEKLAEKNARRRLRERGTAVGPINYGAVLAASGRVCGICKRPVEGKFHFDHIIPLARGGTHTESNLQVSHPTCNQKKGTRLVA